MISGQRFQPLILLCIVAIVTSAIVLEHIQGLLPCPLCVFQRVAYGGVAIGVMIAWVGYSHRTWRHSGWILAWVFALMGLSLALRQVWLQHLGPTATAVCVPGLNYLYHS